MATETTESKKEPWEDRFLALVSLTGNITKAAKGARIDRTVVYKHRARRPEFAKRWAEAEELGIAALEDEARRRAFGESDTLLIFMLKSHRPEKYREETLSPRRFVQLFEQMLDIMRHEVGDERAGRVAERFKTEALGRLGNGGGAPPVAAGTDGGD